MSNPQRSNGYHSCTRNGRSQQQEPVTASSASAPSSCQHSEEESPSSKCCSTATPRERVPPFQSTTGLKSCDTASTPLPESTPLTPPSTSSSTTSSSSSSSSSPPSSPPDRTNISPSSSGNESTTTAEDHESEAAYRNDFTTRRSTTETTKTPPPPPSRTNYYSRAPPRTYYYSTYSTHYHNRTTPGSSKCDHRQRRHQSFSSKNNNSRDDVEATSSSVESNHSAGDDCSMSVDSCDSHEEDDDDDDEEERDTVYFDWNPLRLSVLMLMVCHMMGFLLYLVLHRHHASSSSTSSITDITSYVSLILATIPPLLVSPIRRIQLSSAAILIWAISQILFTTLQSYSDIHHHHPLHHHVITTTTATHSRSFGLHLYQWCQSTFWSILCLLPHALGTTSNFNPDRLLSSSRQRRARHQRHPTRVPTTISDSRYSTCLKLGLVFMGVGLILDWIARYQQYLQLQTCHSPEEASSLEEDNGYAPSYYCMYRYIGLFRFAQFPQYLGHVCLWSGIWRMHATSLVDRQWSLRYYNDYGERMYYALQQYWRVLLATISFLCVVLGLLLQASGSIGSMVESVHLQHGYGIDPIYTHYVNTVPLLFGIVPFDPSSQNLRHPFQQQQHPEVPPLLQRRGIQQPLHSTDRVANRMHNNRQVPPPMPHPTSQPARMHKIGESRESRAASRPTSGQLGKEQISRKATIKPVTSTRTKRSQRTQAEPRIAPTRQSERMQQKTESDESRRYHQSNHVQSSDRSMEQRKRTNTNVDVQNRRRDPNVQPMPTHMHRQDKAAKVSKQADSQPGEIPVAQERQLPHRPLDDLVKWHAILELQQESFDWNLKPVQQRPLPLLLERNGRGEGTRTSPVSSLIDSVRQTEQEIEVVLPRPLTLSEDIHDHDNAKHTIASADEASNVPIPNVHLSVQALVDSGLYLEMDLLEDPNVEPQTLNNSNSLKADAVPEMNGSIPSMVDGALEASELVDLDSAHASTTSGPSVEPSYSAEADEGSCDTVQSDVDTEEAVETSYSEERRASRNHESDESGSDGSSDSGDESVTLGNDGDWENFPVVERVDDSTELQVETSELQDDDDLTEEREDSLTDISSQTLELQGNEDETGDGNYLTSERPAAFNDRFSGVGLHTYFAKRLEDDTRRIENQILDGVWRINDRSKDRMLADRQGLPNHAGRDDTAPEGERRSSPREDRLRRIQDSRANPRESKEHHGSDSPDAACVDIRYRTGDGLRMKRSTNVGSFPQNRQKIRTADEFHAKLTGKQEPRVIVADHSKSVLVRFLEGQRVVASKFLLHSDQLAKVVIKLVYWIRRRIDWEKRVAALEKTLRGVDRLRDLWVLDIEREMQVESVGVPVNYVFNRFDGLRVNRLRDLWNVDLQAELLPVDIETKVEAPMDNPEPIRSGWYNPFEALRVDRLRDLWLEEYDEELDETPVPSLNQDTPLLGLTELWLVDDDKLR